MDEDFVGCLDGQPVGAVWQCGEQGFQVADERILEIAARADPTRRDSQREHGRRYWFRAGHWKDLNPDVDPGHRIGARVDPQRGARSGIDRHVEDREVAPELGEADHGDLVPWLSSAWDTSRTLSEKERSSFPPRCA